MLIRKFLVLSWELFLMMTLEFSISTSEKFPIKTLLKMIDSSIKKPREAEYDKQNLLKHQKTQVWLKKLDIRFTTYCHFTKFEIGPYQKSFQLKQFRKEQILA